jgi:hypothetical protein
MTKENWAKLKIKALYNICIKRAFNEEREIIQAKWEKFAFNL